MDEGVLDWPLPQKTRLLDDRRLALGAEVPDRILRQASNRANSARTDVIPYTLCKYGGVLGPERTSCGSTRPVCDYGEHKSILEKRRGMGYFATAVQGVATSLL